MSKDAAASVQLTASTWEQLGVLFDAHATRLYRLARRLTASVDDALDLVQETFLRAARSNASIPSVSTEAEAWLVRVLVNVRRDQWRREEVRRRDGAQPRAPVVDDPERVYVVRVAIWRALDRLSPRRRAILTLHELDGLPVSAIASLLGITAITVRWHLARARRELASHIDPEAGATNDDTQTALARSRPAAPRGTPRP